MSQMTIDVEFLAGTEIKQAVTEAKAKAILWDVSYVRFKFNGVSFSIGRNADINDVLKDWNVRDEKRYMIVHS